MTSSWRPIANLKRWKGTAMKFLAAALMTLTLATGCATVPVTGRSQMILVPEQTILSTSFSQYSDFLAKHDVVSGTPESRMVKEAGRRIQTAVEQYFAERNMSSQLAGYRWDFNLVAGEEVNAWCLPGGKVVVYSGILPVTRDEAGLAVVMGHEIAHAVARHGAERMSQGLMVEMGGMALSQALTNYPAQTQQLWMKAFGATTQLGVMLPYSRLHESEADRLGLIFMAMAGYDPREAVDFWRRMSEKKSGASPPVFLSTHPSDQQRINEIRDNLPEAMRYYRLP